MRVKIEAFVPSINQSHNRNTTKAELIMYESQNRSFRSINQSITQQEHHKSKAYPYMRRSSDQ